VIVPYPDKAKLELWVIDSGSLDTLAVFLNGRMIDYIADRKTHAFPIERPPTGTTIAIAVHFGGNDGGFSAIMDASEGEPKTVEQLGPRDGFRHSFMLKGV
jgi:hypothetical protein